MGYEEYSDLHHFYVTPKNDVLNEKNGYSRSSHVYYRYLNFSRFVSFIKYYCILIYFEILPMRKTSQNKFILSSIPALDLEVRPLVDAYSEGSNYYKELPAYSGF